MRPQRSGLPSDVPGSPSHPSPRPPSLPSLPSWLPRSPSWQSIVAAHVSAVTVRPVVGLIPHSPAGIRMLRRLVAGMMAAGGPPLPGVAVRRIDEQVGGLHVRGDWIEPPEPAGRGALLYVHGSGYAIASARTHRGITTRLARLTGRPVFACDYRLAPRHRFPSAHDDVAAAWGWLGARGHAPEEIVVAGDSAGGHLALDLAIGRRRNGLPGPAALVLLSPLLDVTFALARERELRAPDPMASAAHAASLLRLYAGGADPDSPRLRFAAADLAGLPPILVQAGGAEMLAADAEHLAALVRSTGGTCELQVWPGQMHVFQALPLLVPEAGAALAHAADFAVAAMAADGTGTTDAEETA